MHQKQFCIRHLVHLPLRLDSCSMRSFSCSSQLSLLTHLFALIGQIVVFACLFIFFSRLDSCFCLLVYLSQQVSQVSLLIYFLSQDSFSLNVGWQVKIVCFCHLIIMLSSLLLLIVKLVFFTQSFHLLSQDLSIDPWPKSTQVTQFQFSQQGLLIRQLCLSRLSLYRCLPQLDYTPTNLLPLAYVLLQL